MLPALLGREVIIFGNIWFVACNFLKLVLSKNLTIKSKPFTKRQILDCPKPKEFADDKFDVIIKHAPCADPSSDWSLLNTHLIMQIIIPDPGTQSRRGFKN